MFHLEIGGNLEFFSGGGLCPSKLRGGRIAPDAECNRSRLASLKFPFDFIILVGTILALWH